MTTLDPLTGDELAAEIERVDRAIQEAIDRIAARVLVRLATEQAEREEQAA